jgi:hypothetical protein
MAPSVESLLKRKLIFVSGKGGVGKSVVSEAVARSLAAQGRRVLWVSFEDPFLEPGETRQLEPTLWHLNCEAGRAFEEYVELKIKFSRVARVFVENKLMRYLAKAAPGIHELVLLGKVWYERANYDHVIVDMLSTGYGVAMFQATSNFSSLFQGGPIQKDALAMLETFADPAETGQLIVALPEEMPLAEGLELNELLLGLFPNNPPAFVVNRCFPTVAAALGGAESDPDTWNKPFAESATEYAVKRGQLETHNLRIWKSAGLAFRTLFYVLSPAGAPGSVVRGLAAQIAKWA